MLGVLTGMGLSAASGLNAFLPLLAMGLLDRFTDLVQLPAAWSWLADPISLIIVGVLFVIEIIADKIPALDHVNDVLHTAIRPASGGIVFGAGTSAETVAVSDPASFWSSNAWVPIAAGIVMALLVHVTKAGTRAVANAATMGVAAPVLSTGEDVASATFTFAAILAPALVVLGLIVFGIAAVVIVRTAQKKRAAMKTRKAAAVALPESEPR